MKSVETKNIRSNKHLSRALQENTKNMGEIVLENIMDENMLKLVEKCGSSYNRSRSYHQNKEKF